MENDEMYNLTLILRIPSSSVVIAVRMLMHVIYFKRD